MVKPEHGGDRLVETPPAAALLAGAAQRDITPPVGIYNRQWGAARHDVARGIHRPLSAGVLALRAHDGGPPLLLVSLDASWFRTDEDEWIVRGALLEALGLEPARVIVNCSHTHASCSISTCDSDKPGGELIGPYLRQIREAVVDAGRQALAELTPCTLTWATGRCDMAGNRNMADPQRPRLLCGYNRAGRADDTLLVGRLTRDPGSTILATLVNYACHPTTLAWENDLISPDFVGAMRQVVQDASGGAPCLFLQGASGDLGPKEQYTGDVAVADANGRHLGSAAVAALMSMRPPRRRLAYQGPVESGAPLGVWRSESFEPSTCVRASRQEVPLRLKPMPSEAQLRQAIDACTDRLQTEKLYRQLLKVRNLGAGPDTRVPLWFWRLGQTLVFGCPYEPFSDLQIELRKAFPDFAVVVMNLANGFASGYVCPDAIYDGPEIYQVMQTPLERGALPRLVSACRQGLAQLAAP